MLNWKPPVRTGIPLRDKHAVPLLNGSGAGERKAFRIIRDRIFGSAVAT